MSTINLYRSDADGIRMYVAVRTGMPGEAPYVGYGTTIREAVTGMYQESRLDSTGPSPALDALNIVCTPSEAGDYDEYESASEAEHRRADAILAEIDSSDEDAGETFGSY